MPPTGGEGGNTAIRDAAQLTQSLVKVFALTDRGQGILPEEISAYENDMLKFSSTSVNRSMRFSGMMTAEGWVYPYLIRIGLRVVNFFIELKRKWIDS